MFQIEIVDYLKKRTVVLEKLEKNAKTQRRFLDNRQMLGLRRLLVERERLISELGSILQQGLSLEPKTLERFSEELSKVKAKEQEILEMSMGLLQEATMEKNRVAAELRNLRAGRSLKDRYGGSSLRPGRRLNIKG